MSNNDLSPAHIDLRKFSYALAPFQQKQGWRMDQLQHALARVQQEVARAAEARNTLAAEFHTQASHIQQYLQSHPDATAHRRGLTYLAQLRQRMQVQDRHVEDCRARQMQLQADCLAQQLKLDGLSEHRAQELQVYSIELARREAAEADREWIGRAARLASSRQTIEDSS